MITKEMREEIQRAVAAENAAYLASLGPVFSPAGGNGGSGGVMTALRYMFALAGSFIGEIADGVLFLSNAAATGFSMLAFGGSTNAFPALKRVGTSLQVRVADDSAFSSLTLLALQFGGGSFIKEAANGILTLLNAASTDFTRLNFGGVTNAFPAFDRAGVSVRAVLADGSALTSLIASNLLATTAAVGAAGSVSYGGTTAATVGAAGAAAALPAQPVGYIIINVSGTQMKLPYYNT